MRAALLAVCLLTACCTRPATATPQAGGGESAAAGEGAIPNAIFIARRKWHIDVGFAVRDLSPELAPIARRFPGAGYLFFGFGDQHYLLSKGKHTPTLLGALLPGPGLILVTALEDSPQQAFGTSHVVEIDATAAEAEAVQSFVRDSIIEPYQPGPYEGSFYFSARARYSGLYTCNTWAAESLQSAGFKVRRRGVLFAGQLWRQVRKLNARRSLDTTPPSRQGILAPPRPSQSQGGGLPF